MKWRVLLLVVLGTVLSESVAAGGAEVARARLVWADFDGDGLQDVYVVRPEAQDALFKNVGDGSFQDVTAQALPCVECASIEVAWQDVDMDRRPDLLRLLVSGSVELFQNRGDGVFEDVTLVAGLERVTGASAARWLDYDADGRADLELETESAALVYHNLGDFLFERVAFDPIGGAAADETSPARVIPGALDPSTGGGSLPDAGSAPLDGATTGSRRADAGPTAVMGPLVAKLHPDPLVVGVPPVDPLEPPGDAVDLVFPPFPFRCALSVKDTSTGDCVLVSSMPALGKLYPISTNLFVSTGGNVGIGTTSPAMKLDVAGTARVTDTLTLAPSGDTALNVSTGSLYKGGALFLHTKGGLANTAVGKDALRNVTIGYSNTASGEEALENTTTGSLNVANGRRALWSNTTGNFNTASGNQALYSNTTGFNNTASGNRALFFNTTGDYNTASGNRALAFNTTGSSNTASGNRALYSNTTGVSNTASGDSALYSNTTGTRNTASGREALRSNTTGNDNTASGLSALRSNTTGSFNTASGREALFFNTTGSNNTASGDSALRSNTTGSFNTASGREALRSNTTGNFNTASGNQALYSNTTGNTNTAVGHAALFYNTTGSNNTASGNRALAFNTTGSSNTASGNRALYSNTTGVSNTASGDSALYSNTTGTRNTASGREALRSNTTGNDNTASGLSALRSNTTGSFNTASGREALFFNTTGSNNTASGDSALRSNTTGSFNTASGREALRSNTTGFNNTASSFQALYSNTTGNDNTASGHRALRSNTTGSDNTASGAYALRNNTTGANNIAIGKFAGYFLTGNDNIAIGHDGIAAESGTIRIGTPGTHSTTHVAGTDVYLGNSAGNFSRFDSGGLWLSTASAEVDTTYVVPSGNWQCGSNNAGNGTSSNQWYVYDSPALAYRLTVQRGTGNVGIGTTAPGFKLDVNGSAHRFDNSSTWTVTSDERLKKNIAELDGALDTLLALRGVSFEYKDPELGGTRMGFIAQEVERVLPQWVEDGEDGYKRLTVNGFEALTVEALREVRAENEELRAKNEELARRVEALEGLAAEVAALRGAGAGQTR